MKYRDILIKKGMIYGYIECVPDYMQLIKEY